MKEIEKALMNVYLSMGLMGFSMICMGNHLMHKNLILIIPHLIRGLGWLVIILAPALYFLGKCDEESDE